MWCLRPSQIRPHHDTYEDVAALFTVQFLNAEAMPFSTTRIDINWLLSLSKCYIAGATYDYEVRCGVACRPKSCLIRTPTWLMRILAEAILILFIYSYCILYYP